MGHAAAAAAMRGKAVGNIHPCEAKLFYLRLEFKVQPWRSWFSSRGLKCLRSPLLRDLSKACVRQQIVIRRERERERESVCVCVCESVCFPVLSHNHHNHRHSKQTTNDGACTDPGLSKCVFWSWCSIG